MGRAFWILLATIALGGMWTGLPARAQDADNGIELTVLDVFDARYLPSGWLPISIQVESSRALQGELVLSTPGDFRSATEQVQPIEVPGGGSKRLDLLIPGPPEGRAIEVVLSSDGEALAATSYRPLVVEEEVMVALLGADVPALDDLLVEPTLDAVHPVELDAELLDLGAHVLDPIDYVVVDEGTLGQLPAEHAGTLTEWTLTGGRLVVAGAEGSGRAVAGGLVQIDENGLGESITMPDLLDADEALWSAVIRPAPTSGTRADTEIWDRFGFPPDASIVGALHTGGGDVGIGWFVGFLLVYLALVGPVNYFVFKRRGKRELMWLSVPALALAFSGVAYGLARETRGELTVRGGGAVFSTAESSSGRAVVTVSSGGGGSRTIGFAGSPASATSMDFFGGNSAQAASTWTPSGTVVSFETSPFSVSGAQGPLEIEGFLDADLELTDGVLTGDVTNRTPLSLAESGLLIEHRFYALPDLEPGATVAVDVELDLGRPDFRPLITGRLKNALLTQLHEITGPVGLLDTPIVFGFVERAAIPVVLDGRDTSAPGKVLMASPVEVPPAPGEGVAFVEGRTELVAGAERISMNGRSGLSFDGFRELTFAHSLPAGVDARRVRAGRLEILADHPPLEMEVYDWAAGEWDARPARKGRGFSAALAPEHFSPAGETYFRFTSNRHRFLQLRDVDVTVETA